MAGSILEITENEYLIKLNKNTFDLSLIRNILKMVEVSNPAVDDYESYYDGPKKDSDVGRGYYSSLEEK